MITQTHTQTHTFMSVCMNVCMYVYIFSHFQIKKTLIKHKNVQQ